MLQASYVREKIEPLPTPNNERLIIKTKAVKNADPNDAIIFNAPFAPREVTYSGFESTYQEVTRPDRKPLLRRSGGTLRRISMQLFIGSENRGESFNKELKTLEDLAASPIPLLIEYDPRTRGNWHIESLSYDSVERVKSTDAISRALVDIEFVEVTDPTVFTINIKNKIAYTNRPKTYTVKKKDTLLNIVKRFYGTTNKQIVKAVAKANKIKNPKHIKPGQKIKLP